MEREFDNYLSELTKLIKDSLDIFKGGEFLVTKRDSGFNYLNVFSEALYEYNKGIFLIERFFKKSKCTELDKKVRFLNKEDINYIKEFQDFTGSIPDIHTLTEEEVNEYNNKLNVYKENMAKMKSEVALVSTIHYDNNKLIDFNQFSDEEIKIMSENYTLMLAGLFAGLTHKNIEKTKIGISSVEHEDYIDIISYPINKEEQAND